MSGQFHYPAPVWGCFLRSPGARIGLQLLSCGQFFLGMEKVPWPIVMVPFPRHRPCRPASMSLGSSVSAWHCELTVQVGWSANARTMYDLGWWVSDQPHREWQVDHESRAARRRGGLVVKEPLWQYLFSKSDFDWADRSVRVSPRVQLSPSKTKFVFSDQRMGSVETIVICRF